MLGPCRVQLFVTLLVVGFLKQNVRADASILEHCVFFHRGRRYVHIYPADGPVLVLDAVNGLDALKYILNGVHGGVFARLKRKTLVPHILQGNDLAGYFFLTEFFAGDVFILRMIRAIHATVDAVV